MATHARTRRLILPTVAVLAAPLAATSVLAQVPDPARTPPAPVTRQEYAARRDRLAAEMADGSMLLLLGSTEPPVDEHEFVQNPPFQYLTGITEPGAALVMYRRGADMRAVLFVRPFDPALEVWNGARLGAERAAALSGVAAREIDGLPALVDTLIRSGVQRVHTVSHFAEDAAPTGAPSPELQLLDSLAVGRLVVLAPGLPERASDVAGQSVRRDGGPPILADPLDPALNRLRGRKSPAELDLLRRAILITSLAHLEAMRSVEPGMGEFEIQALIEATFRRHGANGRAFASIVASGPNSTTLHYQTASGFMDAGGTVVMDIGASYRGYAADITRTVPVDGRFSPEQREIYDLVLAAQKAVEEEARPGVTLEQLNGTARRVLAAGLARLGLIESDTARYDCSLPSQGVQRCPQSFMYYMHGVTHGIGLNVHDPAGASGGLAQGSAITIEPGIYVRAAVLEELPDTPGNRTLAARLRNRVARYRNIGVRIEDDYFVTADGVERVSAGAPREVAEIEALMGERGPANEGRRPELLEWYRASEPR
jgi:Xaa-Pro aminopeptidase